MLSTRVSTTFTRSIVPNPPILSMPQRPRDNEGTPRSNHAASVTQALPSLHSQEDHIWNIMAPRGRCTETTIERLKSLLTRACDVVLLPPQRMRIPLSVEEHCTKLSSHLIDVDVVRCAQMVVAAQGDRYAMLHLAQDIIMSTCGCGPLIAQISHPSERCRPYFVSLTETETGIREDGQPSSLAPACNSVERILNAALRTVLYRGESIEVLAVIPSCEEGTPSEQPSASRNDKTPTPIEVVFVVNGMRGRNLPSRAEMLRLRVEECLSDDCSGVEPDGRVDLDANHFAPRHSSIVSKPAHHAATTTQQCSVQLLHASQNPHT